MSEDNSEYPTELNWDNMEDGILRKMEELKDESNPKPIPIFPWKGYTLILIGIIILAIIFVPKIYSPIDTNVTTDSSTIPVKSDENKSSNATERNNMNILENITTNTAQSKIENSNILSNKITSEGNRVVSRNYIVTTNDLEAKSSENLQNNSLSQVTNDARIAKTNTPHAPEIINENTTEAIKATPRNYIVTSSSVDVKSSEDLQKNVLNQVTKDSQIANTSTLTKPLSAEKLINKNTPSILNENVLLEKEYSKDEKIILSSIPSRIFFIEPVLNTINELPPNVALDYFAKKKDTLQPKRLVLIGEVSTWNIGFGDTKPERSEYESTIISYGTQLNYIQPLKKDFSLLFGLQYQQLESHFDWQGTITDYNITLIDTIIEVHSSLLSGTETVLRGDVNLTVSAERTVKHYNKIQRLQIPIAIGKTWKFNNRLQADILVGGSFNILSTYQGRTLYQGEIANYEDISKDIFNSKMNINGLLNGRLTYHFKNRLGITTGFQYQKSLTNWSAEPNVKILPRVMSWQLGLSYSL